MDPLTAALELANTIAKIILISIESTPPEIRAEQARLNFEVLKKVLEFIDKLQPK